MANIGIGCDVTIAVSGKFLGSAIAAKFVGQNWHSALSIGALMNTRGLMELVALNIGYDLGVLTAEMFAILVLMALLTTFMTGPALDFINKFFKAEDENQKVHLSMKNKYNILISFGNPNTGKLLLRIANLFTRKSPENSTVTALHLSLGNELNSFNAQEFERDNFAVLHQESDKLQQEFIPIFRGTDDIESEIANMANTGDFDLLLTGVGQSIYEGSMLGKIIGFTSFVINPERVFNALTSREKKLSYDWMDYRTYNLLKSVDVPWGILLDHNFPDEIKHIVVPIGEVSDSFLFFYVQKIMQNSNVQITFLDLNDTIRNHVEIKVSIRSLEQVAPNQVETIHLNTNNEISFANFQLMLISQYTWKEILDKYEEWINALPSTLILKP